jgi:hypothetical protein
LHIVAFEPLGSFDLRGERNDARHQRHYKVAAALVEHPASGRPVRRRGTSKITHRSRDGQGILIPLDLKAAAKPAAAERSGA